MRADPAKSHGALESNLLTSFRMDLTKMPATAQVFTRTFMDDIAATSIEEVLVGCAGSVTANSSNADSSIAMPGDRDGGGVIDNVSKRGQVSPAGPICQRAGVIV